MELGAMSNFLINSGFDIWQRGTTFNVSGDKTKTADQWIADVAFGSCGCINRSDDFRFADNSAEICVNPGGTLTFYQSPEFYSALSDCWGTFSIWVKIFAAWEVSVFMHHSDGFDVVEFGLPKINAWQQCCVQMLFGNIIPVSDWPNNGGIKVGIKIKAGDENARVLVDGTMLKCGQGTTEEMEYHPRTFHEEMELCTRYYSTCAQPAIPLVPWEATLPTASVSSISIASLKNKEIELAQKEAELAAREAKLEAGKNKKRIDFGKSERNLDLEEK